MIRFTFRIPSFLTRWLFPGLIERAERHGKASVNKRSKGGIFEVVAKAEVE